MTQIAAVKELLSQVLKTTTVSERHDRSLIAHESRIEAVELALEACSFKKTDSLPNIEVMGSARTFMRHDKQNIGAVIQRGVLTLIELKE